MSNDGCSGRTSSAGEFDAAAAAATDTDPRRCPAALVDQLFSNGHATLHLGPEECRAL